MCQFWNLQWFRCYEDNKIIHVIRLSCIILSRSLFWVLDQGCIHPGRHVARVTNFLRLQILFVRLQYQPEYVQEWKITCQFIDFNFVICTAEERKTGGRKCVSFDVIWIKINWFACYQLGIWNLWYKRKRAGTGRFSMCKEANKVHILVTLNCAETHRWREQVLNDKQLGIK